MNSGKSLVGAPLGPTLLRMSVPGVVGALLFSCVSLVEASFLRAAGTHALAAVALVFPLLILAAMFSAGAIGGAVSGRTARALGAGNNQEARAVLVCAVLISLLGGLLMWLLVIWLGPYLYRYASDDVIVQLAAQQYAMLVFPSIPLFWLLNMLCSVLRGSGDMIRPAIVAGTMLVAYFVLALIIIPQDASRLNYAIRSAAFAMVGAYIVSLLMALYFILQRRQPIRFNISDFRWATLIAILKQGLLASSQSIMTVTYAMLTTVLFSQFGTDWLAGYGLAVRLELIMVPVIFGIGASLIAIVGAYVGAGQRHKAIAIAWKGVLINASLVGGIGLMLALFPDTWCALVGSDETVIDNCKTSLRYISPTYFFFALGLGCYFASQGLNTLLHPVLGAMLRLSIVATGLFWINKTTSIESALLLVASAVILYGSYVVVMLKYGPWRYDHRD